MKKRRETKSLICDAIGCVGFPFAAKAEDNSTLYGLLDAGTAFTSNQSGHSGWKQSMSTDSYFGLRGSEDIGEGMKAIFTLESGFDVSDGKLKDRPKLFGNQVLVGLSGDEMGSLTVGRQTDSMVDYVAPLTLTGSAFGADMFAHPYDNDNLGNSFRVNNSVKYESADFNGLKLGAMYGFSNSPGHFADNRAFSVGTSYQAGAFSVGAAYLQQDNGGASSSSERSVNDGAIGDDNPFRAAGQRTWGTGVSYMAGPVTVGVVVSQTHLSKGVSITGEASGTPSGIDLRGKSADFKNLEVNFRYALTQSLAIGAAYSDTLADVAETHERWRQTNVETDYSLSKRTNLYILGAYQCVSGTDHAVINGLEASDKKRQLAISFGLKHHF